MDMTEKTLKQDYKFRGRIVNMRVDEALMPDGTTASREVVEHNGGVCVAPLTDDGELIFVRQFRYPYSEVLLELPAGKLEKGEDPFLAGKRELKEETGATARSHISFREKAVGIQKVSQSVMQSLPTRRLCGMNQPI